MKKPNEPENPYDVGYKKPPEHTRFRPGKSGNPKGRPKGVNNFATDVKRALASKITVRSGGKGRTVSAQEAGVMVLQEKALKGHPKALDVYLRLAERFNNQPAEGAAVANELDLTTLSDEELATLDAILAKATGTPPTPAGAPPSASST